MSSAVGQASTLIAFGDPSTGSWGIALPGAEPQMALASAGGEIERSRAEIVASGDGWTVRGAQRSLKIGPARPTAALAGESGSTLELHHMDGDMEGGAAVLGLPEGQSGSVRLVAAWVPSGWSLGLAAARPAGAKGHDRDALSVAIDGEPSGAQIFDPRLSSTYRGDGALLRAGIELWLGESEEGDQYPRRLAGEVAGPAVRLDGGALELLAYPLTCHAKSETGIGVYVLIHPV